MKEDMGKIQKDNKQGVVCIRCVRVLCRPSSRYRKAGTGLYTKKRDFLLHYSGAKKSRFFFCTTTQGGHAMKKYWKYSKEQLRDVFSTTEQGLSEMQVKKIRETCGENILEEGKRPGLLRVFLSQFADLLIVILLIAALISMFSGNAEYDCNRSCPGDECSFGNGAAPESGKITGQSEKSVCTVCKSHSGREKEGDPFEGTGSWRSCGTGSW